MKYSALCIGGPYDRRTVVLPDDRDWFDVCERPPMDLSAAVGQLPIDAAVSYTRVRYSRRAIFGIEVWAPDKMRPHDILKLLVERYFNGNEESQARYGARKGR